MIVANPAMLKRHDLPLLTDYTWAASHASSLCLQLRMQVGDNEIESVITRRRVEEMNLKPGDTVTAIIKSAEVMIQK